MVDPADDVVAPFSSRGPTADGFSKPDLVAPGTTLVAARAPGSTIDAARPTALVGTHYFKGTGTSQESAIVSGVAALMFARDRRLTPDLAKATLVGTASGPLAGTPGAGAGLLDAERAVRAASRREFLGREANRGVVLSAGLGSLEASRVPLPLFADLNGDGLPEQVAGEVDALGVLLESARLDGGPLARRSMADIALAPDVAAADGWNQPSLPPARRAPGTRWDAEAWNAKSWVDDPWVAKSWVAKSWVAKSWVADGWH